MKSKANQQCDLLHVGSDVYEVKPSDELGVLFKAYKRTSIYTDEAWNFMISLAAVSPDLRREILAGESKA